MKTTKLSVFVLFSMCIMFGQYGFAQVDQNLRVDDWNLSLLNKGWKADQMTIQGEYDAAPGTTNPMIQGMTFNFYDGIWGGGLCTDTLISPYFRQGRGSKLEYKNGPEQGAVLLNIGGSSRSRFNFSMRDTYAGARGVTPVQVELEMFPVAGYPFVYFNDTLTILNQLKDPYGFRGSKFNLPVSPVLDEGDGDEVFVDSLIINRNLFAVGKDKCRIAARIPTLPFFNPGPVEQIEFDLPFGPTTVTTPIGWLRANSNGTILSYNGSLGAIFITNGLPIPAWANGAEIEITLNIVRRTLSIYVTKMTLWDRILNAPNGDNVVNPYDINLSFI
ncbi:MAG TPA: hypothetical protein PKH07_09425, partial [bacterium]|nr:hypothetical protein [bacterium]